ncbi:MAG: GNAT family N-acetyltransferase [Candidatus Binataceae bacterium]
MAVRVRPLAEGDLDESDRILRLAFGTFIGLADPMRMFGDSRIAHTRWHANPEGAFAVELDGRLAGCSFVAKWGSVAVFGPIAVLPELWDRGLANHLLNATVELLSRWGTRHAGLYTFSESAKHLALYQKFGFWPRFLTAVMTKQLAQSASEAVYERFSTLDAAAKTATLGECREVTGLIYDGLDLLAEINAVDRQRLGETVLLRDGPQLAGFAVCHIGAGSEAGGNSCFVKFAVTRPGANAARSFARLLDACEALTLSRGVAKMTAGVSTARREAYSTLLARRYRIEMTGVIMERGEDGGGYNRPGVYLIDDWR